MDADMVAPICGKKWRLMARARAIILAERPMAAPARFERATSPLGGARSIQLSYGATARDYRKKYAPSPACRHGSIDPRKGNPMQISMYEMIVPIANRMLGSLSAILDKGAAFAEAKKIDQTVLTGARLAPDMFPLTRQVQIAC